MILEKDTQSNINKPVKSNPKTKSTPNKQLDELIFDDKKDLEQPNKPKTIDKSSAKK